MPAAPVSRRRLLRHGEVSSDARYVLYWMTANRRLRSSFALQHAVHEAETHGLPLLIAEGLDVDHPWSSRRMHRAIIEGMVANRTEAAETAACYYPYVEHRSGDGRGWIEALSRHAAVVVVDDAPIMGWQGILDRLRSEIDARVVAVDSVGVLPMRQPERAFKTAYSFRRHLHKHLPAALQQWPVDAPLADAAMPPAVELVPEDVQAQWPAAQLDDVDALLEDKRFRCAVPELSSRGGAQAARERLDAFASEGLSHYLESHRDPCGPGKSELSGDLHFGHLSAHQVMMALGAPEGWSPGHVADDVTGRRDGWWGASPALEAYLEQLVVWRELGVNGACYLDDYRRYESLPDWCQTTLDAHASDPRPYCYELPVLERAETHDEIWNACQRQLLIEGRIHGYLRMLWGKKILEWSPTPRHALDAMVELNNRYAVDGRDPNSYSGIFWTLGRYDRAWGERAVFGKVRYMSSDSTRRKLRLKTYLATFGS